MVLTVSLEFLTGLHEAYTGICPLLIAEANLATASLCILDVDADDDRDPVAVPLRFRLVGDKRRCCIATKLLDPEESRDANVVWRLSPRGDNRFVDDREDFAFDAANASAAAMAAAAAAAAAAAVAQHQEGLVRRRKYAMSLCLLCSPSRKLLSSPFEGLPRPER